MTDNWSGDHVHEDEEPPFEPPGSSDDDGWEIADPEFGGPQRAGVVSAVSESDLVAVNQAAEGFFRDSLPGSWVPGYLAGRGFDPSVQQLWHAGHAPAGWVTLTRHLRALGFTDLVIHAAGLARRSRLGTLIDTFRDRAILPIRAADGTVAAFIGRAPSGAPPGTPKYLNSPRTALYDKSTILFGLYEARDELAGGARLVIVEGPLDAIAITAASAGRYVGVSPCGTALTRKHAAALRAAADLSPTGVLVAFDSDPAGQRAAIRAYHVLVQLTTETSAVILPSGRDPAQILAEHGAGCLAEYLAICSQPLADLVTDTELARWSRWLPHPEGQLNALRAVAQVIASMPPSHVGRQVARLASQLALDHAIVTDAVLSALPGVIDHGGAAGPRQQARRWPTDAAAARPAPGRRSQYGGSMPSHQAGRGP